MLLCAHGLTRQGRDFDALAAALAPHYRIACPDIVGRGRSDWLADKAGYGYPQYCADMAALIARLGSETVDWLGTSMGGLIGMMLAAFPKSPIRRLVLNDIGLLVPKSGVERLAQYVGKDPRFPSLAAAIAYMREVAAPFGALSEDEWRHLTVHGVREEPDGSWRLAYDPAIAAPFQGEIKDLDLWSLWDRIRCPTLVSARGRLRSPAARDGCRDAAPRAPRPSSSRSPAAATRLPSWRRRRSRSCGNSCSTQSEFPSPVREREHRVSPASAASRPRGRSR